MRGIARTMKLETYLNAYDSSLEDANWCEGRIQINSTFFFQYKRRVRQYRAFRTRILRIDAQQREDIQELEAALDMILVDLEQDEDEIEKLVELVEVVEEMRKHRMNKDYELAMIKAQELAKKYK